MTEIWNFGASDEEVTIEQDSFLRAVEDFLIAKGTTTGFDVSVGGDDRIVTAAEKKWVATLVENSDQ